MIAKHGSVGVRLLSIAPLATALMVMALPCSAQETAKPLHSIQRIYVGEMGQSDEAARFRLLLADELTKKKFVVDEAETQADAILSGAVVVRVYPDRAVATAKVALRLRSGERVWTGDFGPRPGFGKGDSVTRRATDVAKALRKAWDESLKGAKIKDQ